MTHQHQISFRTFRRWFVLITSHAQNCCNFFDGVFPLTLAKLHFTCACCWLGFTCARQYPNEFCGLGTYTDQQVDVTVFVIFFDLLLRCSHSRILVIFLITTASNANLYLLSYSDPVLTHEIIFVRYSDLWLLLALVAECECTTRFDTFSPKWNLKMTPGHLALSLSIFDVLDENWLTCGNQMWFASLCMLSTLLICIRAGCRRSLARFEIR